MSDIELILFKSGNLGIKSPKSEIDRCHALSQRTWGRAERCWICPGAIIEEVADAFPDGAQSVAFKRRLEEVMQVKHRSHAGQVQVILEHFGNGKKLMPFQEIGVGFLDASDGVGFLTDQPGLGKTCQALGYLQLHPEWRPAIIVCPAVMKYKWEEEVHAWLETDDTIEVLEGGKPHELNSDITIINYDILKKWSPELQRINPQVIIYDEIHYCKHQKTARSKTAAELAAATPHRIGLTGTPIESRPSEFWHPLSFIDPVNYPQSRFFKWHLRYCDAHKIKIGVEKKMVNGRWVFRDKMAWDFSGASNLDELKESLKRIMLRRTKAQVLAELPEKRRQTILIPIDNRVEYDRADKEFLTWITEQNGREAAEQAGHAEELVRRTHLRRLAIKGKLNTAMDWIGNFLESGEKLIVFAVHKAVIAAVMERFGDIAVKIDGSVTGKAKHDAEQRFQNDPAIRLFVGNIQAAGVGITLTAASDVVFLELDQTPGRHDQAECRSHRITQKRAVNVVYMLAERTIDVSIAAMLNDKQIVINQFTGDKDVQSFELFEMIRGE